MTDPSRHATIDALLEAYGCTYAEESGIDAEKNTPAPLFQLLNMCLLLSARIAADKAVKATRALAAAGLTTPDKMANASWQARVDAITNDYKRYDERTATMLGDTATLLLDRYGGDLRKLREECSRDPDAEKTALQRFSGIGETGADIFLREVQNVWQEAYPHADGRMLAAASKLDLPKDASALADLVARRDFPRLASALIRVDLDDGYERIREAADSIRTKA